MAPYTLPLLSLRGRNGTIFSTSRNEKMLEVLTRAGDASIQLVEMEPFDEGSDNFLVELSRARKADGFRLVNWGLTVEVYAVRVVTRAVNGWIP